ncbi:TPA: 16S rRNA methyltransferase [Patescibacteria group bacterium]|nr:MAG: Ribosomal RNA small subunit methyltransferase E [Parcubacteria group bacterium GW2011_GWF2_40_10]KKR47341.1 MAG: Ribosomal RNA small subunit methyltransferase E [Parcubacteria group bacterium GW2011_GWA2_40_143]KKR59983.1 MAG: Ribosomal RNA small subunit methyltransferase E [Parcubacteria group bacterium GW2011_GWC2_40_31]KKR76402.1 MAG: Ribosomal RNA small subunit methyltransferase E [Parcubacteria group bacterium GW2011_GWE2_40_8]KKR83084.1 MAG: Ribosomal RNA small subunit methyltrans
MRLNRFFGNFDLNKDYIEITDKETVNQIRNVLRLKIGDTIILCDGNLGEATGQIAEYGKDSVSLGLNDKTTNKNESNRKIILYCPILKKENFEWAVQKAVEVGVSEIMPVITKRTVKLNIKKERVEKIIKEAAEQSGRGILPKLHDAISFDEAIIMAKTNDTNFFFHVGAPSIVEKMKDHANLGQDNDAKEIGIFIGPEGGWDEEEIKRIRLSTNFVLAGLGATVLRAETAAIVACFSILF